MQVTEATEITGATEVMEAMEAMEAMEDTGGSEVLLAEIKFLSLC